MSFVELLLFGIGLYALTTLFSFVTLPVEINASQRNLSFEREFGKIIARLDLLAAFTTEKYRRAAISYVQGIVGGTFLQFLPVR
mgnify:CR=1 FL=1